VGAEQGNEEEGKEARATSYHERLYLPTMCRKMTTAMKIKLPTSTVLGPLRSQMMRSIHVL